MVQVQIDRDEDGRWIAEATAPPGALAYGSTHEEAIEAAKRWHGEFGWSAAHGA